MSNAPESLVLDLVEWIAIEPRLYSEVMEAWRTSCPRLTVWEDAQDNGYICCKAAPGEGAFVVVTKTGLAFLRQHHRVVHAPATPARVAPPYI